MMSDINLNIRDLCNCGMLASHSNYSARYTSHIPYTGCGWRESGASELPLRYPLSAGLRLKILDLAGGRPKAAHFFSTSLFVAAISNTSVKQINIAITTYSLLVFVY